jgi:hypothetical protein
MAGYFHPAAWTARARPTFVLDLSGASAIAHRRLGARTSPRCSCKSTTSPGSTWCHSYLDYYLGAYGPHAPPAGWTGRSAPTRVREPWFIENLFSTAARTRCTGRWLGREHAQSPPHESIARPRPHGRSRARALAHRQQYLSASGKAWTIGPCFRLLGDRVRALSQYVTISCWASSPRAENWFERFPAAAGGRLAVDRRGVRAPLLFARARSLPIPFGTAGPTRSHHPRRVGKPLCVGFCDGL